MEYFRPVYAPDPDQVTLQYIKVPLWAALLDRIVGRLSAAFEESEGWLSRSRLGALAYHCYGRWLFIYEAQETVVESYVVSRHFARCLGILVED